MESGSNMHGCTTMMADTEDRTDVTEDDWTIPAAPPHHHHHHHLQQERAVELLPWLPRAVAEQC